jgi:hypothetical protein
VRAKELGGLASLRVPVERLEQASCAPRGAIGSRQPEIERAVASLSIK